MLGEEPSTKHWYQFTIRTGGNSETFTGSSTLDIESMKAAAFDHNNPVELVDLRELGVFDEKGFTWRANTSVRQLFIIPRSIVYFSALETDPLQKAK